MSIQWANAGGLPSKRFTCGHCGSDIAAEKGFHGKDHKGETYIYVCHRCTQPTFFDSKRRQNPGASFGQKVADVSDDDVAAMYKEARQAHGATAYTAAVLSCRKLLMHIAISKGAKVDQSFLYYVEYLSDHHFVPPDAKEWVDHIRAKGNEANHEIVLMSVEESEELLAFSEMLLKVIFEFPAVVKRRVAPKGE